VPHLLWHGTSVFTVSSKGPPHSSDTHWGCGRSILTRILKSYNFWMVSTRALIVHMSIPCNKTFQWARKGLTLWPWPHWKLHIFGYIFWLEGAMALTFTWVNIMVKALRGYQNDLTLIPWPTYLKTFTTASFFWTASTRALKFPMSVPYDIPFHGNKNFWPWCLTYLIKTLTLAISLEWYILGLLYFTSLSSIKTFPWVPTDLVLTFNLPIENFNHAYILRIVCTKT
jgi:hypothetical protein